MKRYRLFRFVNRAGTHDAKMTKDRDGDWVKYEEWVKLKALAIDCASDLEAEVRVRYGLSYGDSESQVHPALAPRFARDMEPVVRLRRYLEGDDLDSTG